MGNMIGTYDVAVVGGGVAGCAAALSAARAGMRTVLLERSITLGGLAANGLVNWWEPMCDGMGRQLIGGIAEEMLLRAVACGHNHIPPCWAGRASQEERRLASERSKEEGRYVSRFSPVLLSLSLLSWLKEEGVEVVFDALLTHVHVRRARGEVTRLDFATQSGCESVCARRYIDATGSCELFFRGGFPTREGLNALSYVAHVADVAASHEGELVRRWHYIGDAAPWHSADKSGFVAGTSRQDVNAIVQNGQLKLYEEIASGKLRRDVVALPSMPQLRTVRCVEGAYTLTGSDANRRFSDSLCVGGDFERRGVWYEIPYRCFYTPTGRNAIAAGRVISAADEAWGAVRVIPIAALTGEVSALIAALSLRKGVAVGALELADLLQAVGERGITVHGPQE